MTILGIYVTFPGVYNCVAPVISLRHEVEEDHPQGDEERLADIGWQSVGLCGAENPSFLYQLYIFSRKKTS